MPSCCPPPHNSHRNGPVSSMHLIQHPRGFAHNYQTGEWNSTVPVPIAIPQVKQVWAVLRVGKRRVIQTDWDGILYVTFWGQLIQTGCLDRCCAQTGRIRRSHIIHENPNDIGAQGGRIDLDIFQIRIMCLLF